MKNLLYILLLLSFVGYAQTPTVYYKYSPSDSTYVEGHVYRIQPEHSTSVKPTIDTKNAKWNGTTWVDKRTPEQIFKASVPAKVTRRQLKLQLTLIGFNMSLIDYVINQLAEPERSIAQIGWNDATEFERGNELLQSLAEQLGLSEAEVDQLFIDAAKL